jgi:cellulose synthase/poly-beta-1,6-N-acetylglucosamine synthase-like glycosyltransferase
MFDLLPFIHGIFYVLLNTALLAGLFLERRREQRACALAAESTVRPRASVIVPVHNEELRLSPLLESLARQDYPGAEIIMVDDCSTDGTAALLTAFAKGRDHVRIVTLEENPGPNHKQYALGKGLELAAGDFFIFTDADCQVPPGWIKAMVDRMADSRTGAIIGPVFKQWPASDRGLSFLSSYQCYDHVVRFVYLAGAAGLGAAGGGFGNNLILRRAALDAAGGYGAVPPSPTEDAALVSRIRSSTRYSVRAVWGRETHVLTGYEGSWKSLINQTLRWNNGGLFGPELLTRINYTLLMLLITLGVLALPLLPLFPGLWPMPVAILIVMLENTIGTLCIAQGKAVNQPVQAAPPSLPRAMWIRELLFMPCYMTLMTLMGFCGIKTTWKESTIRRRV